MYAHAHFSGTENVATTPTAAKEPSATPAPRQPASGLRPPGANTPQPSPASGLRQPVATPSSGLRAPSTGGQRTGLQAPRMQTPKAGSGLAKPREAAPKAEPVAKGLSQVKINSGNYVLFLS